MFESCVGSNYSVSPYLLNVIIECLIESTDDKRLYYNYFLEFMLSKTPKYTHSNSCNLKEINDGKGYDLISFAIEILNNDKKFVPFKFESVIKAEKNKGGRRNIGSQRKKLDNFNKNVIIISFILL